MHVSEKGCVISGEKFAHLFFRGFSQKNAKILAGDAGYRLDAKSRARLQFCWRLESDPCTK
jgi:hypothetical protein